jgi:anhydro-N-acetylmuramic acid kinase
LINLPSQLSSVPDVGEVVGAGISSGTSCDGIDVAIVKFCWNKEFYKVEESCFSCVDYPQEIRRQLLDISAGKAVAALEIAELEQKLSICFADAIVDLIKKCEIEPEYVVTHGQTVAHAGSGGTMQLGNPALIANKTGLWTIGDLRFADIAAGGEGAPILPICDLLLRSASESRIILNLGGVANATFLSDGNVEAFDIGPANALLDGIWQQENQSLYDVDGEVTLSGKVNPTDVQSLLKLIKVEVDGSSIHKDDVGVNLLSHWSPENHILADRMASATEATAQFIASAICEFNADHLFISGGGWHNKQLINNLKSHLMMPVSGIDKLHDSKVTVDSREAIDFALLGHLWFRGIPAGLQNITGAKCDTICGSLWPPVLR